MIEHVEQLLAIVNVQLGIDMAHVCLDRIGRNHEPFGDVRHTAPGDQQVKDFLFTFSQKIPRCKKANVLRQGVGFAWQRCSRNRSLARANLLAHVALGITGIPLGKLFLINNGNMQITQKPRA